MTFTPLDWIGILAGTLTTISLIPQLLKILRTRSAADISWGVFSVFAAGTALWIVWGVLEQAIPVILANAVTLLLAFAILGFKWYFSHAIRSRLFEESVQGARTQGPRTRTHL